MPEQFVHQASLKRPDFRSPVDIIIPFHGQYELVTRLIESIFRYTFSNVYNLCLVDDCSPNPTFISDISKTKMSPPLTIQCIRCQERQGFGGALKKGYDNTSKPWIVFLNSDCEVQDVNWLQSLGEAALRFKDQNVRMVSPRTNNPLNGDLAQKGEKGQVGPDVILEDSHLSMYAFMVHRELFNRVGGFIKSYPYGGYEDEEFAYRMKHYGFKQGVAGGSWIHHEGEATIRDICRRKPVLLQELEGNRELCLQDMRSLQKMVRR